MFNLMKNSSELKSHSYTQAMATRQQKFKHIANLKIRYISFRDKHDPHVAIDYCKTFEDWKSKESKSSLEEFEYMEKYYLIRHTLIKNYGDTHKLSRN